MNKQPAPKSVLKLNKEYRNGAFLCETEPPVEWRDMVADMRLFRSNPSRLAGELHRLGVYTEGQLVDLADTDDTE